MEVTSEQAKVMAAATNGLLSVIEQMLPYVDAEHDHDPPGTCRRCGLVVLAKSLIVLPDRAVLDDVSNYGLKEPE